MKKHLLKKYRSVLAIVAGAFFLMHITPEAKEKENIDFEKAALINFEYRYRTLNRDFLGNKALIPWFNEETKQEIENYAELVKGDFIEDWKEDSIFPQGLVMELENMIYQSLNSSMDKISWEEIQQSIYFETMRELGMEK